MHKKDWRELAKTLDVLSNDVMRKARKKAKFFLAVGDRLFAICQAANTKLL